LSVLPLELCSGQEIFASGGGWSETDLRALLRLHVLYELAAIHETADDDEPMLFFDHWWELPVEERLKQEVFHNMRI